jgi:hypothetical protein
MANQERFYHGPHSMVAPYLPVGSPERAALFRELRKDEVKLLPCDWPWDEKTARAIVQRLESSPHRVHQGAANIIAAEFLPDGTIGKAVQLAAERGWPKEAVLAGLQLAKEQAK